MLELDHIAIAADTLEAGRTYVEQALGVTLQPGGQHAHFGTHNLLLGLEEGLYLEVIAVDPAAPAPGYPRWFDLDRFTGRPCPHIWICRTDDMAGFTAAHPEAGQPVSLARGDLRWQMAVPADGILPRDNRFPAVIEWQCDTHPATRLAPSGCRLAGLEVHHPEARALQAHLSGQITDARVRFMPGPSALRVALDTPQGRRWLE